MAKMKTGAPAQKVTFAAAAAAAVTITVSILTSIFGDSVAGLERFQPELVTIVTFIAGYLMPPSSNDQIEMPTDPS